MVQEFMVLRCFSCKTFQVHQVKKAKKWSCKVCGEKQSIKKIHGQGVASDCRKHVQKLNMLQGEIDLGIAGQIDCDTEQDSEDQLSTNTTGERLSCTDDGNGGRQEDDRPNNMSETIAESKWNRFVDNVEKVMDNPADQVWQGFEVTTDRKLFEGSSQKKRRGVSRKDEFYNEDYRKKKKSQPSAIEITQNLNNAGRNGLVNQMDRPGTSKHEERNFAMFQNGLHRGTHISQSPSSQEMVTSQTGGYVPNEPSSKERAIRSRETPTTSRETPITTRETPTSRKTPTKRRETPTKTSAHVSNNMKSSKWSKFLSTPSYTNTVDENSSELRNVNEMVSCNGNLNSNSWNSSSTSRFESTRGNQSIDARIPDFIGHAKATRNETGNVDVFDRAGLFNTEDDLEDNWWEV